MSSDQEHRPDDAVTESAIGCRKALDDLPEDLRGTIGAFEKAVQRVPKRVACWITIDHGSDSFGYWREDVGFAPVKSTWRLAVRTTDGHDDAPHYEMQEVWAFDEVSRPLRLKAARKVPLLIEALRAESARSIADDAV